MTLVSGPADYERRDTCNDRERPTMLEIPRDVRYAAAWAGSTCRLVHVSVNVATAHATLLQLWHVVRLTCSIKASHTGSFLMKI